MRPFSELAGIVDTDARQAVSLLKALFNPTDYIAISAMRNNASKGMRALTQMMTCSELVGQLSSAEGEATLFSLCTQPDAMNVYFHISSVFPRDMNGFKQRVKQGDVANLRNLYVDLDVKEGCFASTEEAWEFIGTIPLRPTAVVASGSGGLHAYWRLRDVELTPDVGSGLLVRWWAYLSELAGERHIDKLVDVTRMSRLPGTIHWPREGTDGRPTPVELLYINRQNKVTAAEVAALSEGATERLAERRKKTRQRDEELKKEISHLTEKVSAGDTGWKHYLALGTMEEWVDANIPWSSILAPVGWTHYSTDREGRQLWSRPGERTKSAAVDWPESPNVMSLLSTSPETGLFDLLDAEIVLTKWRVMLRLNFNDDYGAAVEWVLNQMGG